MSTILLKMSWMSSQCKIPYSYISAASVSEYTSNKIDLQFDLYLTLFDPLEICQSLRASNLEMTCVLLKSPSGSNEMISHFREPNVSCQTRCIGPPFLQKMLNFDYHFEAELWTKADFKSLISDSHTAMKNLDRDSPLLSCL